MLPPGTLRYLKGHHDGIVVVVLYAISAGVIYEAGALVGVGGFAVAGILYHIRCSQSERHRLALEQLKVEQSVAKAERVKSGHRDLLLLGPPPLPLVNSAMANSTPSDRKGKGGRR